MSRGFYLGVAVPTQGTLEKYGLTLRAWKKFIKEGKGVCVICGKIPMSKRLVVDHEHVPGWKRMPSPSRVKAVRGVICSTCNHYILSRFATPERLRAAADYLDRYHARRDS